MINIIIRLLAISYETYEIGSGFLSSDPQWQPYNNDKLYAKYYFIEKKKNLFN